MKKYPAYKDSGIDWLGDIPEHWGLKKIKYYSNILNGSTPKSGIAKYWDGDISWITPDDLGKINGKIIKKSKRKITFEGLNSCGTTITPKNSIILSTRAPIGHLGITDLETCTNQGCKTIVPDVSKVEHTFLYYQLLISKKNLQSLGQGSTFIELSSQNLKDYRLPFPMLLEQKDIVDFVNRKSRTIDTFIENQKNQIELLKELRSAIINQAVTKGLDPDVKMKDSGIEWIGEIPKHWISTRIKYFLFDIIDTEHKTVSFVDEGDYYVIRTSNIRERNLILKNIKRTDRKGFIEWTRRGVPTPDDVLLTREGPVGESCVIPTDFDFCLGQRVVWLKVNQEKLNPHYLVHTIYSEHSKMFMEIISLGSTVFHLNMSEIGNIPIFICPLEEQNEIIRYLDKQTQKIDTTIEKETLRIELLKEYRQSLISEAVTGKIDVRNAV